MRMIKDYIKSLEEKDPYENLWEHGENPGIVTPSNAASRADRKVIEDILSRLEGLEERLRHLEGNTDYEP